MHGMTTFETLAIFGVLGVAVLGLAYAIFLRWQILKEDKGTEEMQEVWQSIKDGADAYLNQQLRTILPFIGILIVALFFSVWIVNPTPEAQEEFGANARLYIAFGRAVAFAMGAGFSLAVGQIGMDHDEIQEIDVNPLIISGSQPIAVDALIVLKQNGSATG